MIKEYASPQQVKEMKDMVRALGHGSQKYMATTMGERAITLYRKLNKLQHMSMHQYQIMRQMVNDDDYVQQMRSDCEQARINSRRKK
jgi:hypothetical protein